MENEDSFNPNFDDDSLGGTGEDPGTGYGLSLADVGNAIGDMAGDLKKMKRSKENKPHVPKHVVKADPHKPKAVPKEEEDPMEDPVLLRARAMIAAAAEMSDVMTAEISKIGQHRSPPAPKIPKKKTGAKKKSPRQAIHKIHQPIGESQGIISTSNQSIPSQASVNVPKAPPLAGEHGKHAHGKRIDLVAVQRMSKVVHASKDLRQILRPGDHIKIGNTACQVSSSSNFFGVDSFELEQPFGGPSANSIELYVLTHQEAAQDNSFQQAISPVEKGSHNNMVHPTLSEHPAELAISEENTYPQSDFFQNEPYGEDQERFTSVSMSEQGSPARTGLEVDWEDSNYRRVQSGPGMDAAQRARLRVAQKKRKDKMKEKAAESARAKTPPEDQEERSRRVAASQLRAKQRAKAKKKEAKKALAEKLRKEEEEKQRLFEEGQMKAEELRKEAARRAAKLQALKRRKAQLEKMEKEVEEEERQKRLEQLQEERAKGPTELERRLRKETQQRLERQRRQQERQKQKEEEILKQQIKERAMANIALHERQTESLRDPKRESRVKRGVQHYRSEDSKEIDDQSYFNYSPNSQAGGHVCGVQPSPARGSGLKAIRKQWGQPSPGLAPCIIVEEENGSYGCDGIDVSPLASPAQLPDASGLVLPSIHQQNPHQAHVELEADPPGVWKGGSALINFLQEGRTTQRQAPPPPPVQVGDEGKKKKKKKIPVWKQKPIEIKPYVHVPSSNSEFRR
mmetsp:Transcript_1053/g.1377  ORF Transcript_1053/g.1377 Transcript_1053/m.1377 type:complete len:739 (+) Transcript_1053:124-2340(+)